MIDPALVKQHCRIEPDFTDDDQLLGIYTGAAVRYVQTWTRRTLYKNKADMADDLDGMVLNDDITSAILLYIGHLYENREAVVIGNAATRVPLAVESLLQPYKIYGL